MVEWKKMMCLVHDWGVKKTVLSLQMWIVLEMSTFGVIIKSELNTLGFVFIFHSLNDRLVKRFFVLF